jgi:hypothetical protein
MILDELAAHVVADGLGTLGVDFFLHVAPDDPEEITVLTEYAGDDPVWIQDDDKIEIENARVQLMTRSARPEVCRLQAERVYQSLMRIKNETLNGTRILWCQPVDTPAMLGRDDNGRFMTTANFRVAKELTSV